MENNNINIQPVQKPVFKENIVPEESSNKLVLCLVIGLVLIILVVGGVYMYLSRQQAVKNSAQTPLSAGGTTPVAQENLENDLNVIDVTNTDSDFVSIDKDLQQL